MDSDSNNDSNNDNNDNAAKSLQSCPTLCNPIDGSTPGSPSLGFSRQEHWSGLPFLLQCMKVKVKSLSHVRLFETPWTAAHQAPPSMGFSRQEYWSGVPSPRQVPANSGGGSEMKKQNKADRTSCSVYVIYF